MSNTSEDHLQDVCQNICDFVKLYCLPRIQTEKPRGLVTVPRFAADLDKELHPSSSPPDPKASNMHNALAFKLPASDLVHGNMEPRANDFWMTNMYTFGFWLTSS
jgi:hypothetical protein